MEEDEPIELWPTEDADVVLAYEDGQDVADLMRKERAASKRDR